MREERRVSHMRMKRLFSIHLLGIALTIGVLADSAGAHCDSMDGPVVEAARRALAMGDVAPALAWVRPQDEPEIRRAFERTQAVRVMGGAAVELAELWFFENLVRVHRTGEGEPYTGLKPSGTEVPPGIAAAERALETGSVEELHSWLAEDLARTLKDRFERVVATADHDPTDVEAGRRYVAAYSEFVHLAEELHQRMLSDPHNDESGVAVSHDH
jgi:hypothetical protein